MILVRYGLDSMITIDLRNWIKQNFRVEIPINEILKGADIAQLCDKIEELS